MTPYDEFRRTRLWHAIERSVRELQTTREIAVATSDDYVVGFICQELAAQQLIAPAGLADRPGRDSAPGPDPAAAV